MAGFVAKLILLAQRLERFRVDMNVRRPNLRMVCRPFGSQPVVLRNAFNHLAT